jgi:transcriptional regulator with XRE-family HTH domain
MDRSATTATTATPNAAGIVRSLRRSLNLSQATVAERVGISQTYLSALETGRKPLQAEHIPGLAQALGVPASVLTARSGVSTFVTVRADGEMIVPSVPDARHLNLRESRMLRARGRL